MEPPKPDQVESTYLTPGQAAAVLGVTRPTVSRLADAGKIRAIRPNVHYRYLASDVYALAGRA